MNTMTSLFGGLVAVFVLYLMGGAIRNLPPILRAVLAGLISFLSPCMLPLVPVYVAHLAGSPNQHEAEAAMAKAQDLIAKYNLDLLSREEKRDFISVLVGRPALRHFSEDYFLAHSLQDYYFVQGIWVSTYVLERRKMGRVLEISGTLPNVKLASYIHDFVRHFIQSQWREYNHDKGLNRYRLTDFAVGIIEGFRSKLELQQEKRDPAAGSQSLTKMQDPLLKEYLAYRYPHTAMVKTGKGHQDPKVRIDGKRVGKKLVISKGIMEGVKSRGFLLSS